MLDSINNCNFSERCSVAIVGIFPAKGKTPQEIKKWISNKLLIPNRFQDASRRQGSESPGA
ncbi:hypothetical protein F0L16_14940 [Photorhabdus heterorhabditis]|uniref:Uncharacterized protein n=1 Tax=Photorhabdus heterorhabditis TaxID=880156 RepID=A0A5B0WFG1_9GAMM|nr:hypothetical protein F0L16_14940 [Photorhabdus heterorhabditis]